MNHRLRRSMIMLCALPALLGLRSTPAIFAVHAVGGVDVKVTNDNNNLEGGAANQGFDAKNR